MRCCSCSRCRSYSASVKGIKSLPCSIMRYPGLSPFRVLYDTAHLMRLRWPDRDQGLTWTFVDSLRLNSYVGLSAEGVQAVPDGAADAEPARTRDANADDAESDHPLEVPESVGQPEQV